MPDAFIFPGNVLNYFILIPVAIQSHKPPVKQGHPNKIIRIIFYKFDNFICAGQTLGVIGYVHFNGHTVRFGMNSPTPLKP